MKLLIEDNRSSTNFLHREIEYFVYYKLYQSRYDSNKFKILYEEIEVNNAYKTIETRYYWLADIVLDDSEKLFHKIYDANGNLKEEYEELRQYDNHKVERLETRYYSLLRKNNGLYLLIHDDPRVGTKEFIISSSNKYSGDINNVLDKFKGLYKKWKDKEEEEKE